MRSPKRLRGIGVIAGGVPHEGVAARADELLADDEASCSFRALDGVPGERTARDMPVPWSSPRTVPRARVAPRAAHRRGLHRPGRLRLHRVPEQEARGGRHRGPADPAPRWRATFGPPSWGYKGEDLVTQRVPDRLRRLQAGPLHGDGVPALRGGGWGRASACGRELVPAAEGLRELRQRAAHGDRVRTRPRSLRGGARRQGTRPRRARGAGIPRGPRRLQAVPRGPRTAHAVPRLRG